MAPSLPWRPEAHAGTFYPADPARLRALVDRQLATATRREPPLGSELVGVLVPHAGLEYSGPIAALGWASVGGEGPDAPDALLLVGTDHGGGAGGISVWTGGSWRCPLGEIAVGRSIATRLVSLGPPFASDDAAHAGEHSLEVQLPFIARSCPGAEIVPMLVSSRSLATLPTAAARVGRLLAELRDGGRRAVLVASSDFAHYPAAGAAQAVSDELLEPIVGLDPDELARREAEIVARRIPGLVCGMCGLAPTRFALEAVRATGAVRGVILGRATSADAPIGTADRTVGYAAVAFVR